MKHVKNMVVLVAFGSLAGCASAAPPPNELMNARAAYDTASHGPAARVALVDLHTARQDLDRAEQSYLREPRSERTRDLAYIAERRAEIASARGAELDAEAQRQVAEREGQQLVGQQLQAAQSTVHTQQQQLDTTRQQLQSSNQQVQATAQRAQSAEQQLAASEQARQNAERQAHEAMESLRRVSMVREDQRGVVITLSGEVLFAPNETTLLPIAQQRLDEVARALQDQGARHLTVEGHTDSRGSPSANQTLSQARAEAVRGYLVTHGIDARQIDAVGMGASRPIADNSTPEGRASNRRVEIVISPVRSVASVIR